MSGLGKILRKLREEKQLSLRIVAANLNLDQAILSKIERGQRFASRAQVLKFADFFQKDKNELLVYWLSDKLVNDIEGEDLALKALQVAEEQVLYKSSQKVNQNKLMTEIPKILSSFSSVKKAWIFGSYSRGDANESSDIDILIDVPADLEFTLFDIAEIKEKIQNSINGDVDVVMLSAIRPQVKKRIENDLKLIYEAR